MNRVRLRNLRVIPDNQNTIFTELFCQCINHLFPWRIIIAKQNNGIEFLKPVIACCYPIQIIAPGWDGNDIGNAGFIECHGIALTLCDHQRLREDHVIHVEQDRLGTGLLPFLALDLCLCLRLSRNAELMIHILAVQEKAEDDVALFV